ncbi:MAG TPA: DUF6325 family protein [Pilimelia sp.]|nr:DUF6325 family protein [Pilimelia sp.]
MAATGPLEFLVVGFPGAGLPVGAGSALERIHEAGNVRVIEAILIVKSDAGVVRSEEVTDVVGLATVATDDPPSDEGMSLIDRESIADVGEAMDNNSTALALVLEHHRAHDVISDFRGIGGIVLASTRMPGAPAATAIAPSGTSALTRGASGKAVGS